MYWQYDPKCVRIIVLQMGSRICVAYAFVLACLCLARLSEMER
jgi:hypothetical protein